MRPRYKKLAADLRTDLFKNLMLVIAIGAGVFGIGTIMGGHTVLKREIAKNYMRTNPASATIKFDKTTGIDQALVDEVQKLPGIETAERHATIQALMKTGSAWKRLLLFVKSDFNNMRTNKVTHISGSSTPTTGTMLVERTAYRVMKSEQGGRIFIKTPCGETASVTISGTVHDPGLAPAWQEETGYGYITLETLNELCSNQGFDELRIVVSDPDSTTEEISAKSEEIAEWLRHRGYQINHIQVPPPKCHPHQVQMNTILTLFTAFSFMILILGSILVTASISTLMVKQVRQIGIMKVIGATSYQISTLYLLMILLLSVSAVCMAIPLSRFSAGILYTRIASLLNIHIYDQSIPNGVAIIQMLSGVVIPLMIVAAPVFNASRIKAREAMDTFEVTYRSSDSGFQHMILSHFSFLGEIGAMSLRNVFRKRSRLAISLGLLASGGAMFLTALNISYAWDESLQKMLLFRHHDLEIRLDKYVNPGNILSRINQIDGIKRIETWRYSQTSITRDTPYDIVNTYPDKGHGDFVLIGLPVSTQLLNLPMQEGKWLNNSNGRDVVLNQISRALIPGIELGNTISLSVDKQAAKWRIIGFVEDIGSPAAAFVPVETFKEAYSTPAGVNMLRVSYQNRSDESSNAMTSTIEDLLIKEEIPIHQSIPVALLHNAIAEHMHVLVNSLLFIAVLMAMIGTIGLMSSMSMNIMDRIREIGVLRAIGATRGKITGMIFAEGLIIGIMSIFLALAFSLPLSFYIGKFIGHMAFRMPLPLCISIPALIIWTMIVFIGSNAASFYPAKYASGITVGEALSYE